MDNLRKQIFEYIPKSRREVADRDLILRCMEVFPDTLTRENKICHFTASNWIVNPERTRALMIHHNIEGKWMWTGGHADGESDLFAVALREAEEETGLDCLHPVSEQIFSLEVLGVPPHVRRGEFVSSHIHLDCSFLLEANESAALVVKPDENSGVRWIDFEEIVVGVKNGTMAPHYIDLIERL